MTSFAVPLLESFCRLWVFIEDASFHRGIINNVKESILTMSRYIEVDDSTTKLPTPKVSKNDPFLSLLSSTRTIPATATATSSTTYKIEEMILKEFQAYLASSVDDTSTNPLIFWRARQSEYTCLSQIARKIYVIQASSGESEHNFSTSGDTLNSKRSNLA